MQYKISLSSLFVSLLFILSSCGGNKGDIVFENFELATVADGADSDSLRNAVHDFDGRWEVSTSGVLPVSLGNKDVSELRDSLFKLANISFDDNKLQISLPSELIPLDKSKEKGENKVGDGKPGSRLYTSLMVDMLTRKVAVFHNYMFSYPEGAAHGVYANSYINYDIESGKIITLNAIFTSGFEKLLTPAIRRKLEESDIELLVDPEEIRLPKQFRITADGIDFIYGIYEIAPYSEGEPTVTFYNGELSSILTPTGKALLLAPVE